MKKLFLSIAMLLTALVAFTQQPSQEFRINIATLSGTDTTFRINSENAAYVWSVHGYVSGCDSDSSEIKTYYSNWRGQYLVETGDSYNTLIPDGSQAMLYDDILIAKELIIVFDKNDATAGRVRIWVQKNSLPMFIP
jgi:hypothetical protein